MSETQQRDFKNPLSHSDAKNNTKKDRALHKIYTYGYMNVDANPLSFNEIKRLARDLQIPDFKVLELEQYKRLVKNYKEPENCIIFLPYDENPNRGHYVSCFRQSDGSLNYQDSFATYGYGKHLGESFDHFPLRDVKNRTFHTNKVKYQSVFANNCGYLALLHLYTHDKVDPKIKYTI